MLAQLCIKNLAVVETLSLSFKPGMSVITGETGAGKSILVRSLNLVLGGRIDTNLVRKGKEKAQISASFEIINYKPIQVYLSKHGLDDNEECVLRRIISIDGRSKAFVNGISVGLSTLKGVGELLLDMHGQNEHQLLLRPEQQQQLLDSYGNTTVLCAQINDIVGKHKKIAKQIDALSSNQEGKLQQQSLLNYQLNELDEAKLNKDELNSIEADFKASAHAATLIEKVAQSINKLENEDGINQQLLSLNQQLSQNVEMDAKLTQAAQLLAQAQLQTQEGIYELTHYLNHLSIDEAGAEALELRLTELHNLSRKHQCQIPQLLSAQAQIKAQLAKLTDNAQAITDLHQQQAKLQADYQQKAKQLSTQREAKARQLSSAVSQIIQLLGMPGGEFIIDLSAKDKGVFYQGAESVDFCVKTNKGQDFKPLKKVVSGGELSRISLAISVVSSASEYTPTLIFDEVDVGISGAVAQVVGQKLKQLSKHYQVICITHLAQVAAQGHQHLSVHKTQTDDGAQTTVQNLSSADKITEIARILSGVNITQKALDAAAEMLEQATST